MIAPPAPIPTSTTLGSSASSVYYGQTLTLTASVSPTDGGGTVEFLNGASPVAGCSSLALTLVGSSYQALCTIPSLTPGSYNFSARYGGDAGYASSSTTTAVGVNVAQAPLVVTASSASSTYGSTPPIVTASYTRIRERRLDILAHERGHLFDHGHVGQPGRSLRHVVHRCGRSQLRHHLRQRHAHGRARRP